MSGTRAEVQPLAVPSVRVGRSRGAVAAGSAAGLVAGGAMAASLVAAALIADAPALLAFQAIGAVLPGISAGTAAATLGGVLVHAAASAALGVVFAALVPRDFPRTCTAGVGVGYALFVLGFAIGVFLPGSFVGELHAIGGSWVIAHAVYGAALGLSLR